MVVYFNLINYFFLIFGYKKKLSLEYFSLQGLIFYILLFKSSYLSNHPLL